MSRSTVNTGGSATRIPVTTQTAQPVGTVNPAVTTGRSTAPPNIRTLGPFQPRLQSKDFPTNRAQRAVQQALAGVGARYDAKQQVVPGVAFTAMTQTVVPHGLGRAFVGASVVNPSSYLGYKVERNADPRLDAYQVLVTCVNTMTGDVVIW